MPSGIYPRQSISDRFFSKVNKTDGCWIWSGYIPPRGYGMFGVGVGKLYSAHRMSYMIHKGDIPQKMIVMHSCDNKKCVNPDHLELGTYSQNIKDAYRRGLRKTGDTCFRGHPFDRVDSKGNRDCTQCQRILNKRYWAEGRYKKLKGEVK